MCQFLYVILLLLIGILHAEEHEGVPSLPSLTSIESEPSSIIDGCVNVISGEFFDYEMDMVISGPEPLKIERMLQGNNPHPFESKEHSSWVFNHDASLLMKHKNKFQKDDLYVVHFQKGLENSCTFDLQEVQVTKKISKSAASLDWNQFLHGITNSSKGIIAAQTNPSNRELYWQQSYDTSWVMMEEGTRLLFKGKKEAKLEKEYYPSGLFLKYDLDKKEGIVSLHNKKLRLMSYYNVKENEIYSQNGQYVRYSYEDSHIKSVLRSDAPMIEYSYYPKEEYYDVEFNTYFPKSWNGHYKEKCKLAKKSYPDNRYKKILYYTRGMTPLQNHKVEACPLKPHFRRVSQIHAPIGPDSKPQAKYKFYYHLPSGPSGEGCTGVHDALNHCTNYNYNHRQRLTAITKIFANGVPYTTESLYWPSQDSSFAMRLQTRSFKVVGAHFETFARCYTYDDKGNILNDNLCGNICGTMQPTIQIDGNGGISGQYDSHCKTYSYSNDQYHLVTELTEHELRKTFQYLPNSNLLASCLHHDSEGIYMRHFYSYDENAMMVEHIIDDGSGLVAEDLFNMTERKIERIKRSQSYPIGLPLEVKEYYLDLTTGEEHLILKKINTHDKRGRLIRQETYGSDDAFCFAEEWTYDDHGNLTMEVNRLGQQVIREYDANDNMINQKGPDERLEQKFTYDYMNRLVRIDEIHPGGILTKRYRYDLCSNPIATIDVLGNETNTEYDEFNRPIRVIGAPLINGHRPITSYEYDELSNPIKIISPEGYVTEFAYTILGKPYHIRYQDGTEERFEYDLQGRLVKEVAKNGVQTFLSYDSQGRVIKKEVYTSNGDFLFNTAARYNTFHLLEEIDAAGIITSYSYDVLGRKSSAVKGDLTTSYDYDSLGRVIKTTVQDSSGGSAACSVFDSLNRVVEERTETCDGKVLTRIRFNYDTAGNKSKILQEDSITRMEYDTHGIPRKVTDPEGNVTYSRLIMDHINPQGQRVFILETTDPNGMITQSIQDTHGKVVEILKKNPYGEIIQKTEYQKNSSGVCIATLETVFLPDQTTRQIINRFEYDSAGRLVATIQASGTADEKRTSLEFNTLGQKSSSTKPSGESILYQYDSMGRLNEYFSSDGSIHYRYTYNICSNPILIENLVDHNATSRTYDSLQRIIEEKLANSLTCQMTYTPEGHLKSLKLPDASSIHYSYEGPILKQVDRYQNKILSYSHEYLRHDLSGRLLESSLIHNLGNLSHQYTRKGQIAKITSPYYQAAQTYDALGNLIKRTYKDALGLQEEQFTYDSLNQLASEMGACSHTYTHDSVYNRCSKDGRIHSHNALNQLLSDENSEFSYDMNGNLTKELRQDSIRTFTYDALDRLKTLQIDDQRWEFFYDEENRCISYHHNDRTEKILYIGQNDIGTADKDGSLHTLRVLGKGLGAELGAAVALEIHGKTYAPLHDHNGNVTTLIDPSGTLAETYRYSSFGEEIQCSSSENPWRFASKRHFADYLLFGQRFYNPSQGRWLTQDPLGYQGGPNLYAYVSNNPLTHFDLYGLVENQGLVDCLWAFCTWAFDVISSSWCGFRDSCSSKYHSVMEGMRGVGEFTAQAIKTVGSCLTFSRHAIMIPFVRDIGGCLGHFLSEGTLEGYPWTWTLEKSQYVEGSGEYLQDNVRMVYCNGIDTTFQEFNQNLKYLSDLMGMRVDGSFNSTDCIPIDLCEALMQKFGVPTESVNVLVKTLRSKIQEVGGVGSNGIVAAVVHSKGGQILHCALKQLSAEERKMIVACTLGSAKFIEKEMGLKYIRNYVSTDDFVPRLGDPMHYKLAKRGFMSEVSFIESLEPGFLDHSFRGKTYGKALEIFRDKLYKML